MGLVCLPFLVGLGDAGENNPTVWPYGGASDPARVSQIPGALPYLNFGNIDFKDVKFDDQTHFSHADFQGKAYFRKSRFTIGADFLSASFQKRADFRGAQFCGPATFSATQFHGIAGFSFARFDRRADFIGSRFKDKAVFERAVFAGRAFFEGAVFDGLANFEETIFQQVADFEQAEFTGEANYRKAMFKGTTVDFSGVKLQSGIDLRLANLDSVSTIYLEGISFPDGEFRVYWHQLRGKEHLRIKLRHLPESPGEHFTRIEILYEQLRDNFIAQRDNASADEVMYELGWQREEILKEWWWSGYGFLFGYGYKPWRFITFVVCPIVLIFAGIWYLRYYEVVLRVVDPSVSITSPAISLKTTRIGLMVYDHSSGLHLISDRISRYWHVLHFSTSVLLGMRFNKEWNKQAPPDLLGKRTFLYVVTFEWLLGIALYVTFAVLAKGHRLAYVKGLLGF
jgi:uncharacterized protein YjbI with pentapeptide repeats